MKLNESDLSKIFVVYTHCLPRISVGDALQIKTVVHKLWVVSHIENMRRWEAGKVEACVSTLLGSNFFSFQSTLLLGNDGQRSPSAPVTLTLHHSVCTIALASTQER